MPRFTLDVGEQFDKLLDSLAASHETTKSEVVRRAVAVYAFLSKETHDGRKVSIVDENDRVIKEVVLP